MHAPQQATLVVLGTDVQGLDAAALRQRLQAQVVEPRRAVLRPARSSAAADIPSVTHPETMIMRVQSHRDSPRALVKLVISGRRWPSIMRYRRSGTSTELRGVAPGPVAGHLPREVDLPGHGSMPGQAGSCPADPAVGQPPHS